MTLIYRELLGLTQELFCANLFLLCLVKLILDLLRDVRLPWLLYAVSLAAAATRHLLLAHLGLLRHLLMDGQSQHHGSLTRWVWTPIGAMKGSANGFACMGPG